MKTPIEASRFVFENSMMKMFSEMDFFKNGDFHAPETGYYQYETIHRPERIFIRISVSPYDVNIDLGSVVEVFSWSLDFNNMGSVSKDTHGCNSGNFI